MLVLDSYNLIDLSISSYLLRAEHLPEQYQVCLSAQDTILKHAFDILQDSDDTKEKLQAMELFKDTHLVKLELLSNATTIDSALNYIKSKQQEQHKRLASDPNSNEDNNNGKGQLTTGRQTVF
jgi:hypothetical protein